MHTHTDFYVNYTSIYLTLKKSIKFHLWKSANFPPLSALGEFWPCDH